MAEFCDLPGVALRIAPNDFPDPQMDETDASGERTVILAGGCFWCTESVFKNLDGVIEVTAGYSGGDAATADYRTVCTGTTNHAEAIAIRYDASQISFGQLLKVFFAIAHDPTTRDRQGGDIGSQYRSAIFFANQEQHDIAQAYLDQIASAGIFKTPVVTQLVPLEAFHTAEAHHQNYAELNPDQGYIRAAAQPKVEKLRTYFGDKLKQGADA